MVSLRKLGGLLAVFASAAAFTAVSAQPAQAASPGNITNWGSGLRLDVDHFDNLYGNGARIQQWACSGQSRQAWGYARAFYSGGHQYYQIVNNSSGTCLDATDGRNADSTPVQQ